MKILITGGLGFVGTQLSIRLLGKGHQVTVVDHSPEPHAHTPRDVRYVSADTTVKGAWQENVSRQDAVINLAGASIFSRWNTKTKQRIRDSRILTTRNVVEAMPTKDGTVLCSTSCIRTNDPCFQEICGGTLGSRQSVVFLDSHGRLVERIYVRL